MTQYQHSRRCLDAAFIFHAATGGDADCICGVEGPDYFGNYDQLEDDACPLHGSADPVSEKEH